VLSCNAVFCAALCSARPSAPPIRAAYQSLASTVSLRSKVRVAQLPISTRDSVPSGKVVRTSRPGAS